MPELSILMPVYNCEKYVAQAIDSIINQTFGDWELFVCDDGSTDGTRSVLERYIDRDSRVTVLFNPRNIGKVATITNAYKLLTGQYVVFHDSDDLSHPERFDVQLRILNDNPFVGLVGTGFVMVDSNGRILNTVHPVVEHEQILKSINQGSPFHFPTVMFRKHCLDDEKVLFRPFFGDNNEDVDLSYRILTKSAGRNISRPLYVYRILGNSISRRRILRNAIFYYCVARDLALARLNGLPDWLEDSIERENRLQKYKRLTDRRNILIYANSVSYFLSYDMYRKAILTSFSSLRTTSPFAAVKLIAVTFFRVVASWLKPKETTVFSVDEFSKSFTQ